MPMSDKPSEQPGPTPPPLPADDVVIAEDRKGMVVMPSEADVPIVIEDMAGGLTPAQPEGSAELAPPTGPPPASAEE
jgi:hypothetical protein